MCGATISLRSRQHYASVIGDLKSLHYKAVAHIWSTDKRDMPPHNLVDVYCRSYIASIFRIQVFPWRWFQNVTPKRRLISARLDRVTSQRTTTFTAAAMRSSGNKSSPCCRANREMLNVICLVKNLSLWNPNAHYQTYKIPSLNLTMNQRNIFRNRSYCFSEICCSLEC
jgi:hypothetical protein